MCMDTSTHPPISPARQSFISTRYWPELDGLRALSIVMVLAAHTSDRLWAPINGSLGVTLFFVISGFLITTLLLREEADFGRVSLSKFYVRRVFRIVPLYALALGATTFLVLVLGLGSGGSNFLDRLPLLATFNGEFAGSGTFSHSWSLGIEEKFYILWPLVAFAIPFVVRHRIAALLLLVPAALVANFIPGAGYVGIYLPIVAGCLLAALAHHPRTFVFFDFLTKPAVASLAFIGLVAALLTDQLLGITEQSHYSHVAFSVAAVLALPGLIASKTIVRQFFALKYVAYFGTMAYSIYLFHPFVLDLLDRVIPRGQGSVTMSVARLGILIVVSFASAVVLHHVVEKPMIQAGRRLTARSPSAPMPSDSGALKV